MKPADECELDSYINSDCQGQGCEKWVTKVILMQMIEVESEHKVCPICGEILIGNDNSYYCRNCEMQIFNTTCYKCNERFKFTKYKISKMSNLSGESANLKILIKESVEGFKNITDIDEKSGKPNCPYCGNTN